MKGRVGDLEGGEIPYHEKEGGPASAQRIRIGSWKEKHDSGSGGGKLLSFLPILEGPGLSGETGRDREASSHSGEGKEKTQLEEDCFKVPDQMGPPVADGGGGAFHIRLEEVGIGSQRGC